jgi:hypothetical protein
VTASPRSPVGELRGVEGIDANTAVDDRRRRAERHAELGFESRRRAVVNQDRRHDRVHADVDRFDVAGAESLASSEIEQRIEGRMRARARRIEFHGDTRLDDFPAAAEIGGILGSDACSPSIAARNPCGLRSPPRSRSCRNAPLRQNAVASRETGVQRLDHRAEVLFSPDASDAAIASACRTLIHQTEQPAAAAAPIVPSVDVQCQPR